MAERLPPGCRAPQATEAPGIRAVPSCPGSLAEQGLHVQGGPHGHCSVTERSCLYGRLPHRMGSGVATQDGTGAVACQGTHRPHQCVGTASGAPSPRVLFAMSKGKTRAYSVGQYLDRLSRQSSRGDQVGAASEGVLGPFGVGRTTPGQPAGNIPTRREKPAHRLPLLAGASSRGVASPPGGGSQHLGPLRQGGGGSVCLAGVDALSPLVLLDGADRPPGPGCSSPSLAPGSFVCLPAAIPCGSNTPQGSSGGSQTVVGGPLLASTAMIPTAVRALSRQAMVPSAQGRPSVPAGREDLAPQSSTSPAVGLAAAGSELQRTVLSDPVWQTILNARALSTRQQYENRWKLFAQWCVERAEDPVSCPVATILDFLQSLLERGRSPSTLKVYVAAISCHHVWVGHNTVGRHTLVFLFLKGARCLCPPTRPRSHVTLLV
uniref:Core-binding (CB) domain-containing protein n=1 Tax=Mastacembelus armatus TaxID=205130 RepID=A0A3Q3LRU5_9TELE